MKAFECRDDIEDDWSAADLSGKIQSGRIEDLALVIRVLAYRMCHVPQSVPLDEISLYGDLGHALESITAAIAPRLRTCADGVENETFVEEALERMDLAGNALGEISEGWI